MAGSGHSPHVRRVMKDKTFLIILALVTLAGIGITTALVIHGFRLWQSISIVEMIANWR